MTLTEAIRDSFAGLVFRQLLPDTLLYPEEKTTFEYRTYYEHLDKRRGTSSASLFVESLEPSEIHESEQATPTAQPCQHGDRSNAHSANHHIVLHQSRVLIEIERRGEHPLPRDSQDHEQQSDILDHSPDRLLYGEPSVLDDGTIVCDWYSDDDPENPQNWTRVKKLWVVANIAACSFVVYMSAPIWTPSTEAFILEYST